MTHNIKIKSTHDQEGWVYIILNTQTEELSIGITYSIDERLTSISHPEKLVYHRNFGNAFDALAHKHLLESLTRESVLHNIMQFNPKLINLSANLNNPNPH